MPLPQTALDVQQAACFVQMSVVATAITTRDAAVALQLSDPSGPHAAAEAAAIADLDSQRKIMAGAVAQLSLILLQSPSYQPATEAERMHDVVYQTALALAPSF